jgi:Plasmid pRiA4b ORF-3-like protein
MPKKLSNVPIFKFRVIIDTEADVFRDIEIETDASFEDLHRSILDSFDFEAGEMASFYMSNEQWEKGLEIALMDMGEKNGLNMKNTKLSEMISQPADKILYVYDFMRMWIFYVELMEIKKDKPSTIYPRVALAFGDAPSQDSKELDLFGDEFDQEEFDTVHGNASDSEEDEENEDEFGFGDNDYFDANDFDGQYHER